jgi:hypothetical protein
MITLEIDQTTHDMSPGFEVEMKNEKTMFGIACALFIDTHVVPSVPLWRVPVLEPTICNPPFC